jgi:hypothetical protein
MKNLVKTSGANVHIAAPVPEWAAVAGSVVPLGSAGLTAVTHTDRATTATIAAGTSAQGLADTEATCELLGVATIVRLAIDAAIARFAKVYVTGAGVYTGTAGGNTFIGYAFDAAGAPGTIRVALTNA